MPAELVESPSVARARGYIRGVLPEPYREARGGSAQENFAMRFALALEYVLDPIVARIDMLPANLDVDIAPAAVVRMVAAWLGVPCDEAWELPVRRAIVRNARALRAGRGTLAGAERLLRLAYPDCDLSVSDNCAATWSEEFAPAFGPQPRPVPVMTVRVGTPTTQEQREAIRKAALDATPPHVDVVVLEEPS
jgi:phage tail-like protein